MAGVDLTLEDRLRQPKTGPASLSKVLLICAFLGGQVGCAGAGGILGTNETAGTYRLDSINGSNLPFAIVNQSAGGFVVRLEVLGAEFTLGKGGTVEGWTDSRSTQGGSVVTTRTTYNGTFSLDHQTISFSTSGASQGQSWALNSTGTLAGGTVTLVSTDGFTYRYKK